MFKQINYSWITALPVATSAHPFFFISTHSPQRGRVSFRLCNFWYAQ